ncbi:MAG TPA: hypothetical protein VGL56_11370 [Fimbriimonadaceae bacterium]
MNDDLKNSGPSYVTETEWKAISKKKRVKLAVWLSLIPIGGVLAAGLVVYSTVSARYALHKKLLDSLAGLKNYSVQIYKVDAGGKKNPWREELYYGNNFEIKLFNGQIIVDKVGHTFSYVEPKIGGNKRTVAWTPTKSFLNEVARAVPHFEMFQHGPDDLQESKGQTSHTFTFSAKDLKYTVRLDEQDTNPVEVLVQGNTLDGPENIMQCQIAPLSSPSFDEHSPVAPQPAQQQKNMLPLPFSGPGGDRAKIVAADMNVRGDAFFLIRTDAFLTVNQITREHLDRYYKPEISAVHNGGQNLLLVKYIALDDNVVQWPTTLDATFSPGYNRGSDTVSFKYTFGGPTCYLMPLGSGMQVSDLACYEFMFDAAQARADYFANSFLDKGVTVEVRGRVPAGYVEIAKDRPKSVRENVAASFYGHQLMMAGEDVTKDIADGWGNAAHMLVSLGQGTQAHNAFSAADALRRFESAADLTPDQLPFRF